MPKNILAQQQDRFYYGYGHTLAEAPHTLSNEAFTAGARWAMRESSALSPHIAKFTEMLILLGVFDADDSATESSNETSGAATGDTHTVDACGECGSDMHPLSAHVYVSAADARHES